MAECLILNEASLPFNSIASCEAQLIDFFKLLYSAHLNDISIYRGDGLEGDWQTLPYVSNFQFGSWVNRITDESARLIVKSTLANVRCLHYVAEDAKLKSSLERMLHMLASDQETEVLGLGVAALIDGYGLSFLSKAAWNTSSLAIVRYEHENGVDKYQPLTVSNVFSVDCIDALIATVVSQKQSNKDYFLKFQTQGNVHFPNLIFCQSALKDLVSTSVTTEDFPKIIDALTQLNSAIVKSKDLDELIVNSELTISGESVETMKTPKHSRKRYFIHPKLGAACFEIHVKNFPGAKRMHILPDYNEKTVSIGYFGRHLSTVSEPK